MTRSNNRVRPLIRAFSQWTLGIALAITLTLFLIAMSGVQLSAEGVGERLLRRQVSVTTNLDEMLLGLQEGLRESARSGNTDPVRLPDFPIPVDIPRDEARTLEGSELRERILSEAGDRLYHDGQDAWADGDDAGDQDIETISTAGAIKHGMGLLTSRNHDIILALAVLLGALSAVMAALLLASTRGWTRLVALSCVLIAAALPLLAAAVGARFAFKTAQEEADPFAWGLLELGVEAMALPIRNYLALTIVGFASLLLAVGFMWASERPEPSAPQAEPYSEH